MKVLLDNSSTFLFFHFSKMQFTDEQINKFSELYETHFGEKLERRMAFELAEKLYRSIELTYQQISETDIKELQKCQKQIADLNI